MNRLHTQTTYPQADIKDELGNAESVTHRIEDAPQDFS